MVEEKAWYEKDNWWELMAPVLFSAFRWENTAAEVDRFLSLVGLSPGSAVLDLCCGEGRHSLELARRGFQVTGVDWTRCYLDKGVKLAEAEGLPVQHIPIPEAGRYFASGRYGQRGFSPRLPGERLAQSR